MIEEKECENCGSKGLKYVLIQNEDSMRLNYEYWKCLKCGSKNE